MNFIAICLHCLDMRDFHSAMRDTPFLDRLRERAIFVPMGRGQGHHQADSLNAELTGRWTARCCDSTLTPTGYTAPRRCWLPPTLLEHLAASGYDLFTCIDFDPRHRLGTFAVAGGMKRYWLKDEPARLRQFSSPTRMSRAEWLARLRDSRRFYAHIFVRETHRPWAQVDALYGLLGVRTRAWLWARRKRGLPLHWPYDAYVARRAALEAPDAFAALRRRALTAADAVVAEIFEATRDLEDVTYVVYSNHGEVYDHFRYNQPHVRRPIEGLAMVEGTSHGPLPYEVLYANMQFWVVPGHAPVTMRGIGRSIDFAPTIVDLAGVAPLATDGESMRPHVASGRFPARDRYAEDPFEGGCISMVRADGAKLIALGTRDGADPAGPVSGFAAHRMAVFDLATDPCEYVNLLETPFGREVMAWGVAMHRELAATRDR